MVSAGDNIIADEYTTCNVSDDNKLEFDYDGTCYSITSIEASYFEAAKSCQNINGSLAVIPSEDVQVYSDHLEGLFFFKILPDVAESCIIDCRYWNKKSV